MKKRVFSADKLRNNLSFFVVFLIFGFILVLQLRSVKINDEQPTSEELARASELSEMLIKEKEKNESLSEDLAQANEQLDQFRKEASESGDYANVLSKQIEKVEMMAGLRAVKGPGLTVTLSDSTAASANGVSENNYVIHHEDLLAVVNELWDAGAEAISINGERLIATSEIRCAGSVVSVNNNRYSIPYVISAIGDPATMKSALEMRGGVVDKLTIWDIDVQIEEKSELTVNAYSGTISQKYAVPVTTGE